MRWRAGSVRLLFRMTGYERGRKVVLICCLSSTDLMKAIFIFCDEASQSIL
jgi:hypothetical protein